MCCFRCATIRVTDLDIDPWVTKCIFIFPGWQRVSSGPIRGDWKSCMLCRLSENVCPPGTTQPNYGGKKQIFTSVIIEINVCNTCWHCVCQQTGSVFLPVENHTTAWLCCILSQQSEWRCWVIWGKFSLGLLMGKCTCSLPLPDHVLHQSIFTVGGGTEPGVWTRRCAGTNR